MTEDQADALVDQLAATWPSPRWLDATIVVYVAQLEELRHDAASTAVGVAVATLTRAPSLAELLALYRAELARLVSEERRSTVDPDKRIPETYLDAGRRGLANARAILRRTGSLHD